MIEVRRVHIIPSSNWEGALVPGVRTYWNSGSLSYCRKNSVRDKVISNKVDVFREIHSTDRMQSVSKVWPSRVALGEAHTLDRVWDISEGKR